MEERSWIDDTLNDVNPLSAVGGLARQRRPLAGRIGMLRHTQKAYAGSVSFTSPRRTFMRVD